MVRLPLNSSKRIIEKTVGFLREKWIAAMLGFPSNSSQKIIETMVGFLT